MSQDHPIEILSDEEERIEMKRKVKWERNKQAFLKAHLESQFDVILEVIKMGMQGTKEDIDRQVKEKILSFFESEGVRTNLQNQGNYSPRKEADYSDPNTYPIPNEIIIYGVDFLNTRRVKGMFPTFNPKIAWINSSHCKVTFDSSQIANEGIRINLKDQLNANVKIENEEMEVYRGWFQLKPYEELTFERRLQCRFATSQQGQVNIHLPKEFEVYSAAKKKFLKSIAEQVRPIYQQYLRQFEIVPRGSHRSRQRQTIKRTQRDYNGRDYRRDYNDRNYNDRNYNDRNEGRDYFQNTGRKNSQSRERSRQKKKKNTYEQQDCLSFSHQASYQEDEMDENLSYCTINSSIMRKMEDLELNNQVNNLSFAQNNLERSIQNQSMNLSFAVNPDPEANIKINTSFNSNHEEYDY